MLTFIQPLRNLYFRFVARLDLLPLVLMISGERHGGCMNSSGSTSPGKGIGRLTVTDLDSAKSESLVQRLAGEYPSCEARTGLADLWGVDLLINATPVGMSPTDGLPLAIDTLTARTRVIDENFLGVHPLRKVKSGGNMGEDGSTDPRLVGVCVPCTMAR